jgi:hypothetical protein
MPWGLGYPVREAYKAEDAEQLMDDIPFAIVRTVVDGISMAIWPGRRGSSDATVG